MERLFRRRAAGGRPGGAPEGSLDFHMLTTGVIEVAEDGQTAKGVWYSPGMVANQWMYEMYAIDFVKEDGVWKSWHRTTHQDFSTALDSTWAVVRDQGGMGPGGGPPGGGMAPGGALPEGDNRYVDPNATPETQKDIQEIVYEGWSPTTMPQYRPYPPVPYTTFSETFSYCPPYTRGPKGRARARGFAVLKQL